MAASPGLQLSVWPLGISFCIGKFPEEKKEINSSEYRAPRSVGLLFSRILVPRIPAVWMPPSCCFFYCVCCCFVIVVEDCWLMIVLVHHSFLSSLINICVYPWEVYYPIKEQVDSLK